MFTFTNLALGYFIGMFVIGLPIAKLSLITWKDLLIKGSKLPEFLFFPSVPYEEVGSRRRSKQQWFLDEKVHDALESKDTRIIAQYIALVMLLWPIRLALMVLNPLFWLFAYFAFVDKLVVVVEFLIINPACWIARSGVTLLGAAIAKCQRCTTL